MLASGKKAGGGGFESYAKAGMPGTTVNAVLEKFQREHNGIPCLKLTFDGQEETNEETRIEAFMHQAHQGMESRLKADENYVTMN